MLSDLLKGRRQKIVYLGERLIDMWCKGHNKILRNLLFSYTHSCVCVCIYIYTYMCVCVCVCGFICTMRYMAKGVSIVWLLLNSYSNQ